MLEAVPDQQQAAVGRGKDKDIVANERAMAATSAIRKLGRQLQEEFDRLDEARKVLLEHAIDFVPSFTGPVGAAYEVHKGLPFWDRRPRS